MCVNALRSHDCLNACTVAVDDVDLVDVIAVPICETASHKPLWMFNKVMDKGHSVKACNFSQGQGGPDEQGP